MKEKMKKIAIFTGNRAEFGLLLPLLIECHKNFEITLVVSGAHVIKPWYTISEIEKKLDDFDINCNIEIIKLDDLDDKYIQSLSCIYNNTIKIFNKHDYDFCIAFGDRIEMFGFALGAFFKNIPLVHYSGGDITNVPYYDANVRHSVSKLAHIHWTTNERSKLVLIQLGEEPWRIYNTGLMSYDYDRLKVLPDKEVILKELGLHRDELFTFFTYHPSHIKTPKENLEDFKLVLYSITQLKLKTYISFPNNDPGGQLILNYIEKIKTSEMIKIIANLGSQKLLSLYKHSKCIVIGNSSSGLMETPLYCVPVINIGDRQLDRSRGKNVFNVDIDLEKISNLLKYIMANYSELKKDFDVSKYYFGDGTAAIKATNNLIELSSIDKFKLLFKKFLLTK